MDRQPTARPADRGDGARKAAPRTCAAGLFHLLASLNLAVAVPAAASTSVHLVRVPDQGLQPEAAVDDDGVLHLVTFHGEPAAGDLRYSRADVTATREPAFGEPVRVNSRDGAAIAVGTVRGAHLALGAGGVHVAWMSADRQQPGMMYARSGSGGGFEPQRNVSTTQTLLDGGGSVAADEAGNVWVAWHAGHGEVKRRVWVAASADSGRTFASEVRANPVETGACGCCGMRAAGRDGALFLLYRTATESIHRDMHLVRFDGTAFAQQLVHPWELSACPMSTAAIVPGADGDALLAWETDGQVYWGHAARAAAGIGATAVSGEGGQRKHPALAVDAAGRVAVAWTEGTGWNRGGDLAWQVYGADGEPVEAGRREAAIPVWSRAAVVALPAGGFAILH